MAKNVKIWMGVTKGELMKLAYDNNQVKLANVDVAIPENVAKEKNYKTYWWVMDYNNNAAFGELRNLQDVAKENGINFTY